MYLPGSRRQPGIDHDIFDAGGTITTGGTPQIVLPQHPSRNYLLIQNISDTVMTVGIGPPAATATVSGGKVTAIAAVNNGLGYTVAPRVHILGGFITGEFNYRSEIAPQGFTPATAVATISGGALTGITVNNQGAGYVVAPLVLLQNGEANMGGGATIPSATAGVQLQPGLALIFESSFCPTSAVAIFCATTGKAFACKYAF